jgi:hypothetical protein
VTSWEVAQPYAKNEKSQITFIKTGLGELSRDYFFLGSDASKCVMRRAKQGLFGRAAKIVLFFYTWPFDEP